MKTGVIGLGAMGAPIALNLSQAGHLQAVWNRSAEKAEAVASETGAVQASDPADLAAHCELVILSVARDEDVLQVIELMLPGLKPGTVVLDSSTVAADTARLAAKNLQAADCHFLDGPVSGGVEGARKGTLAMMIGGEAEILERVRPALQAITATLVHMGPTGSGQATKAVNQIMAAGINQAVTEALSFAAAMQLDTDKVIDVVSNGAAGNWFVAHRGKTMLRDVFEPGFKLALHHKDLAICLRMAQQCDGLSLPLTEQTLADYASLMQQGHGDDDISGLYRLKKPGD